MGVGGILPTRVSDEPCKCQSVRHSTLKFGQTSCDWIPTGPEKSQSIAYMGKSCISGVHVRDNAIVLCKPNGWMVSITFGIIFHHRALGHMQAWSLTRGVPKL